MATMFWDAKGVTLLDILPQGQCINAAQYCSTLVRLRDAIHLKRPGLLRSGVVLQHDNATRHSANLTQQWLQRNGWELLPPPSHSPDLAPSDFHFFGPLKRHLGGMAFKTEGDHVGELKNWCAHLDLGFFRNLGSSRFSSRYGSNSDASDRSQRPMSYSEYSRSTGSLDIDYKKKYEDEKTENDRLRRELEETKKSLLEAKTELDRAMKQRDATRNSDRLTEKLKAENKKLKEENRALTRVVARLSK
ncbi:histone-lysine N-methyltransferase SETMAR [Elysia marginata]|uniref:Histone-lysine N-methyltransferase SETMAR n=1 Tax=Elysia marginata TaxID=1093978 RepID=A0AAV4HXZ0_9GAST|nr:histone-lysine N-methyltransferase SETMAR [Elysia marginata]